MLPRPSRTFLASLLMAAGVCHSLGAQEEETKAAPKAVAPKAKRAQSAPKGKGVPEAALPRTKGKLKPVDINHATKEEIAFMLGIDVSLAAKIVAGRPYPTKARLLTNHILTAAEYASLKDRVLAGQGSKPR